MATKKKKAKKNDEVKNNYQVINEFDGVTTEVMHIRNHGVIVRERTTEGNVSSVFVPDAKPKKKGVNYSIVKDTEEMRNAKAEKRAAAKAKKGGKKSKKK